MTSIQKLKTTVSVPVLIGLLTSGLLMSCEQNPLADKADAIQKAVPPDPTRKAPVTRATSKDAVQIDSLDFFTFKEGIESVAKLGGRVLDSAQPFELSIDNLSDFPGATFDPATGEFRWKPPRALRGEYVTERRLTARIHSPSPNGGTAIGTIKDIPVFVSRAEVDPEIISVGDLMSLPLREGEATKFSVVVKDPDAEDRDGARPNLTAIPVQQGLTDISSMIYMEQSSSTSPNPKLDAATGQWTFRMVLDLTSATPDRRGRNFTSGAEDFKFGLKAVSRFGRVAMKNDSQARIVTNLMVPEVSWLDAIEVVAGQENQIQFTVFDPYNEGKLSVTYVTPLSRLPGGTATGKCVDGARGGAQLCTINWKPPEGVGDAVGSPCVSGRPTCLDVEFEALSQTQVPGDNFFIKQPFKKKLHLIKVTP